MTVRKEMAEELNLKTISDLVEHALKLIIGAEMEFLERTDGRIKKLDLMSLEDQFTDEEMQELNLAVDEGADEK